MGIIVKKLFENTNLRDLFQNSEVSELEPLVEINSFPDWNLSQYQTTSDFEGNSLSSE